jgi:hypothetical protein
MTQQDLTETKQILLKRGNDSIAVLGMKSFFLTCRKARGMVLLQHMCAEFMISLQ